MGRDSAYPCMRQHVVHESSRDVDMGVAGMHRQHHDNIHERWISFPVKN